MAPQLTGAGFRIIAPDMRGFGETDMAATKADYEINAGAVPDIIAICDELAIARAHIVGHDFGAPVAWALAAQHPDLFQSLTAVSVGHARAFLRGGTEQKLKSWYILFHQFRYLAEAVYRFNNWMFLRSFWPRLGNPDDVIANLSRPGRLTAGLDWYRANMSTSRMIKPPEPGSFGEEIVRIPTLGVWSDGERYLSERQMKLSREFVDAPWRYERIEGAGHWIPEEAPERLAELLIEHWSRAPG